MLRDNGNEISIFSNKTETWTSSGYTRRPVTYVSGRSAVIKCKIKVNCKSLDPGETRLYIKGRNSDGYDLPPQAASVSGNFISYRGAVNTAFQNLKVDYFKEFDMTWYVSTTLDAPNADWIKVGRTYVELYVLHKKPILSQDPNALVPTLALHTTIHLGCKNAKGLNSPESIVDRMYKEFRDQKVYTYNGAGPMNYWGPIEAPGNFCFTTIGLLNYLGSRCQAWASFFNDMIRIQGITGSEIAVVEWNYILSGSNVNLLEVRRDAFFGDESDNVDLVTAVNPAGTSGFMQVF